MKNQNLQFFSDIYQNLSVTLEWVNRFKQNLKHKETICQVTVLFNMLTIIINNWCVTMMYSLTTCHNKFLRENFAHPSVMAIFRKLMLGWGFLLTLFGCPTPQLLLELGYVIAVIDFDIHSEYFLSRIHLDSLSGVSPQISFLFFGLFQSNLLYTLSAGALVSGPMILAPGPGAQLS